MELPAWSRYFRTVLRCPVENTISVDWYLDKQGLPAKMATLESMLN